MFLKRFLKFIILKCKFAKKCKFDYSCNISLRSQFEGLNKLYSNVSFSGCLGLGSFIAKNSALNGKIGRFCSIANNVATNTGIHPYKKPFATTAPCFFSLRKQNGCTFAQDQCFEELRYADKKNKYGVIIENDVWICEGVFINPGVRISNGAVVLARAVVTKDVPPYAIVGGVPAQIIGFRYDKATIEFLLKCKWWNNDKAWFEKNWKLLCDIEKLRMYYKNSTLEG